MASGSKRRSLEIMNAKTAKKRNRKYKELLKLSNKTVNYLERALKALDASSASLDPEVIKTQLSHFIPLAKKVIDQTTRRVVNGESVPAAEKIYSIFEDHTDIIIKDNRDIYYGHKICLSGGASNLILDCQNLMATRLIPP